MKQRFLRVHFLGAPLRGRIVLHTLNSGIFTKKNQCPLADG
jgi:hypothetical protein